MSGRETEEAADFGRNRCGGRLGPFSVFALCRKCAKVADVPSLKGLLGNLPEKS